MRLVDVSGGVRLSVRVCRVRWSVVMVNKVKLEWKWHVKVEVEDERARFAQTLTLDLIAHLRNLHLRVNEKFSRKV